MARKGLARYDNFTTGIDATQGDYPSDPRLLAEAENVLLDTQRNIKMRPPLKSLDLVLDSQTQGLIWVGCSLCTIAPKNATINHTGSDADQVVTLRFNEPSITGNLETDRAAAWSIKSMVVYQNKVIVSIEHTIPTGEGLADSVVLQHILDPANPQNVGPEIKKPTYVEDPWAPTNWDADGTRPVHFYGKGEIGRHASSFVPVLNSAAEKVVSARPNGDASFSGVANPRVWNPLSVEDLQDWGEAWYYLIPQVETPATLEFIVSERFDRLDDDRSWSGYVLEFLDSDGRWQKFLEVEEVPSIHGTYSVSPIDSRYGDHYNEIALTVRWDDAPGVWLRWRAQAGTPSLQVVEGGELKEDGMAAGSSYSGSDDLDGQTFQTGVPFADFRTSYVATMSGPDGSGGTQEFPLFLGQDLHYTVSSGEDGNAKIKLGSWRGICLTRGGGQGVETVYTTNIEYDALRYLPIWEPEVFVNGALVSPGSYSFDNNDGKIRLTLLPGIIEAGDTLAVAYISGATRTLSTSSSVKHLTGGTYVFEGKAWDFPAVLLTGMPANKDVLVGVPHFPLIYGVSGSSGEAGNAVFTDVGAHTFTVPDGVNRVLVEVWAGGGGGGGAHSYQSYASFFHLNGAGGGGGGYVAEEVAVTPGTTINLVVGAGGAGGTSRIDTSAQKCGAFTNGTDGTETSASIGAAVVARALGGVGGTSSAGAGGAGGLQDVGTGEDGTDGENGAGTTAAWQFPAPPRASKGGNAGGGGIVGGYGSGGNGAVGSNDCLSLGGANGVAGRAKISWGASLSPWYVQEDTSSIPLTGYERYHVQLKRKISADSSGNGDGASEYFYGNEPGKESRFFVEKTQEYLRLAGASDAGYLDSRSRRNACGGITAFSTLQNRLAVHYEDGTVLYQFSGNPELNALLDEVPFGSIAAETVEFYNSSMILTQGGFRLFNLSGLNYDGLRENNVGRAIAHLPYESIEAAAYWPAISSYVAVAQKAGERLLLFFTYSPEGKVAGWTEGTVRSLGAPDRHAMSAVADRCYWRIGDLVRYLDASAGACEHYDDEDQTASDTENAERVGLGLDPQPLQFYKYKARVRFGMNDVGSPMSFKKWLSADVETQGRCRLSYYERPGAGARKRSGPEFVATSYINRRTPLVGMNQAIGLEMESNDLDGWSLRAVVMTYTTGKR